MSELAILVCPGLLVYWLSRTRLLLTGSQEEIDETLEHDLWRGRRLLLGVRAILGAPTQLAR